MKWIFLMAMLVLFLACPTTYPRPANPSDENGEPPTFTFMVTGPGINKTISSNESCPPDGITNNFQVVYLQLPADRTFNFTYAVTDHGGVDLADIISSDTTMINLFPTFPDRVSIVTFPEDPQKMLRLPGRSPLYTSEIITGRLQTMNVTRRFPALVFQAWDGSRNQIFRSLTVIVAPEYEPEFGYEGECR